MTLKGSMVVRYERSTRMFLCWGMNFFLISLENQSPMETAKAPKNTPMAELLTPRYAAPPAATAAPAVHRGQWARTAGKDANDKKNKRKSLSLISYPHEFLGCAVFSHAIDP